MASGLILGSLFMTGPLNAQTTVDNAQYMSGPLPLSTTLHTGEALGPLVVSVKNTGTSAWPQYNGAGSEGIVIGPWPDDNPSNRAFDAGATVHRNIYHSVVPGETVSIDLLQTLGMVAPQIPGTYNLQWKMYRYNDATRANVPFGDPIPTQPLIITVVANYDPTFSSIAAPTAPIPLNQNFSLSWTVRDADSDRLEWSVDWGDGTPVSHPQGGYICQARVDCPGSQSFSSNHTWTTAGTYSVIIKVTDGKGGTARDTVSVTVAAPTLQDNAQLLEVGFDSSGKSVFKPGETPNVFLKFKNTGTSDWEIGKVFLYPLPYNDADNRAWQGGGTVGRPVPLWVSPGGTAGFNLGGNLGITAPQTPGTYKLQWRLYRKIDPNRDEVTPFGDVAPSSPLMWTVAAPTVTLNAQPAGGTFPTKTIFAPGEIVEPRIIMRNTGTQNWLPCNQLLLEISKANLNIGGQANDSDCSSVYAKPGEEYAFQSLMSLPTMQGTYTYQWQMASRDPGQTIDQARRFGSVTSPWTVTIAEPTPNNPPVIQGITAPSVLSVREAGTWKIRAYDPEGKPLSYYATWGDEMVGSQPAMTSAPSYEKTQNITFTHYYTQPGVYEPRFTVVDSANQKADTSASVTVNESTRPPEPVPTGSMKVTVVNGDIQCIKAPCGVLKNAKVAVYALNGDSLGDFIGSSDTSGGAAGFYEIPVGRYVAYASAPNFNEAKGLFTIRPHQGDYLTIRLSAVREILTCPPDCPDVIDDVFEPEFPNGSLIQLQRTKGVYYIENGQKRPIRSRAVFDARGFDMSDVIVVDKKDFDRYPTGPELTASSTTTTTTTGALQEGWLVKALNDKAVYRIESGKRRPFLSGSVFEARGYYWSDIVVVNPSTLEAYSLGDTITYSRLGDGFLIKSPRHPEVFWTENGQKRHIANESVFAAHAFRWQDIHVISEDEVASYPTGSDMDR